MIRMGVEVRVQVGMVIRTILMMSEIKIIEGGPLVHGERRVVAAVAIRVIHVITRHLAALVHAVGL